MNYLILTYAVENNGNTIESSRIWKSLKIEPKVYLNQNLSDTFCARKISPTEFLPIEVKTSFIQRDTGFSSDDFK